jgi:predicted nucleotidyltransferase
MTSESERHSDRVTQAPDGGAPRDALDARLSTIEAEHGVRIVYAVESGSRAWGFPSRDSDFDVRFVYLHPAAHYLSIAVEKKRDVIETPIEGEWDIGGWDLRKALKLMLKSNPPLCEWLDSPIVYREVGPVAAAMRALLPRVFNPIAAHFHYLSMAEGNFRSALQGERVKQKKYFYVLRPLLACRWLERELGVVPTAFDTLVDATLDDDPLKDGPLVTSIRELVASKREGVELGEGPRLPTISAFIEGELTRQQARTPTRPPPTAGTDAADALFREALDAIWS